WEHFPDASRTESNSPRGHSGPTCFHPGQQTRAGGRLAGERPPLARERGGPTLAIAARPSSAEPPASSLKRLKNPCEAPGAKSCQAREASRIVRPKQAKQRKREPCVPVLVWDQIRWPLPR
uniref:Uncharacterized protein n=1 Tax=Naja naja TaxID=35670 RepID=A0A8C6V6J9_NAJNA